MAIQRSQLVQEVRELTDMFRTEDTFSDVRAMLLRQSISPEDVLLAGLIENADWYECGAVVLPCLLYTSPSPRDLSTSRMPSSA